MKQIELISKRKPREKHFLQEDGTIIAKVYNEDVHYLSNGKYEDIDNSLKEDENFFYNKKEKFKIFLGKSKKDKLLKMEHNENFIEFDLRGKNECNIIKTGMNYKKIRYQNIIDKIDMDYEIKSNKVKESIIIKDKESIVSKFEFEINSNLQPTCNSDGSISFLNNEIEIFKIDAPYMIDSKNCYCNNIQYNLKRFFNKNIIELFVDENWLLEADRAFPVIIDPTITNTLNGSGVQDTYICSETPTTNYNVRDYIMVGAELYDGDTVPTIYRSLIKFNLPSIPTSCEIIDANLRLSGYPKSDMYFPTGKRLIEVHKINQSWNETDVTWNNMNNKYDNRVETCFYGGQSYYDTNDEIIWEEHYANITHLVKSWYTNEENYGIMLKTADETGLDSEETFTPKFMSNANIISGDNPQPTLEIRYKDLNGIEDYIEYFTQDFSVGKVKINSYNGNLVGLFNIGSLKRGKTPVSLNIIYNTNDIVTEYNEGYGLGCRLSLAQTITYIPDEDMFEYVDYDGTKHYFIDFKKIYDENGNLQILDEQNTYYDEDGLNLKIVAYNDRYELIDKENTIAKFDIISMNFARLTNITDIEGNQITIEYTNNLISKITDSLNRTLTLIYNNNKIETISDGKRVVLNYNNNKLSSIMYGESEYFNLPVYFDYNDKQLISSIQYDVYKKVDYEYYDKYPYKVKKVIDSLGGYFTISYNNLSTTIKDNQGKIITLTYNSYGNVKSVSNLKSQDFVKSALGRMNGFGENYQEKNRLTSYGDLIGYINNLLTNTSFEENNNIFLNETGVSSIITNICANSGNNSLKITNTQNNKSIYKELEIEKGKSYTFSGYLKNNTISNIYFILEYYDKDGILVSSSTKINEINQDFNRYDVSIDYPEDASSMLKLKIGSENNCEFYIDDIQLEEGQVANHYNYIDNSDFSQGTTGWILDASRVINNENVPVEGRFEIITLNDGSKALKIKMGTLYSTGISRSFPISGEQGDNYTISFWYKNQGIICNDDFHYNCCIINFEYEYGQGALPSINLNPNNEEWQFFTYTFYAEHDYSSIYLSIFEELDANDLYITNISLIKNIKKSYASYDKDGNLITIIGNNDKTTTFNYDENNNLIKMFEESGNNLSFEYDNEITNRIKNGISDLGISNEVKYNEYNNPVLTRISNKIAIEIKDKIYKIRLKGTQKYLNLVNGLLSFCELDDFQTRWAIETLTINGNKYYKIKSPMLENKYISKVGASIGLNDYNDNASLFEFIKNENGSFLIKLSSNDNYIKIEDENLVCAAYNDLESEKYELYFENVDGIKFIENTATYTEDNRSINKIINSSFNEIHYGFDSTDGKMDSFINTMGTETMTFYDNLTNNIIGVRVGERSISYIYNDGLLSTVNYIVSGKILKSYFYSYDDKKRLLGLKVGTMNLSYPLYTNIYDQNTDNLTNVTYANNSNIIYEYDNLNRIYKVVTDNDSYKHYYYKNGSLGKIISNNHTYKYTYDNENKIKNYVFDDFNVNYIYNNKSLITKIIYRIKDIIKEINYDYGIDDILKSVTNNTCVLDYVYDELGRICEYKYNNSTMFSIDYISNGNRTTSKIKSIWYNGNNEFSYKYDKLENITHVYFNKKLKNKYIYDEFNQIIREDNYIKNTTTKYKYDESGNILSKRTYKLNTFDLIESNEFKYYMPHNCDVLTSFNGNSISYDDNFNPISIGSNVELEWINKNQLHIYTDNTNGLIVNYEYDKDGYRTKKIVNNKQIEYYWSNGNIVIEKQGEKIFQFIYDINGELLGFDYNGNRYNYLKSSNQEIIGILDSNNNLVAKYEYDAWGNLISILDANNYDISTNNEHIANLNPFIYKSYYYDKETGLYYLNSRYYNPIWSRYLTPDLTINNDIFGLNPYLYCSNNPVSRKDANGNAWFVASLVANMVGGIMVSVAMNTVSNLVQGKEWDEGLAGAIVGGAVGGIFLKSSLASAIVTSASRHVTNEVISYLDFDHNKESKKDTPFITVKQSKEVNLQNVSDSFYNVGSSLFFDVVSYGASNAIHVDKLSNKIAYFNDKWARPEKWKTAFFGNYTHKKQLHDLIEGTMDETVGYGVNLLLGPTELNETVTLNCPVSNSSTSKKDPFGDYQQPLLK